MTQATWHQFIHYQYKKMYHTRCMLNIFMCTNDTYTLWAIKTWQTSLPVSCNSRLILSNFYRAAWNAPRSCDENSVCLSVRPSVRQTRELWQNGRKICLDFYMIIYPSFLRRSMVGGGRPLLPEILGLSDRVGAKSPIFDLFSLVAPQP